MSTDTLHDLRATAARVPSDSGPLAGHDVRKYATYLHVKPEIVRQWIDRGWVREDGAALILTRAGYRAIL